MFAIETLVAIAVAKMVAQKIAACSISPLKPYCCSLFCAFSDDLNDLEKELLYLEAQLKEKDKWLFGIEVSDDGQTVLAQTWHRHAKQLAFEIEDTIDEFVSSEELYHESTCVHKVEDDAERSSSTTGEVLRMHCMAYELARFISNKDILVVLEGEEAVSFFSQEKEEAIRTCCLSQEKEKASLTYCDFRYAQLPVFTNQRPQKARSLILRPVANVQGQKHVILAAVVSELISGNKYLRVLDLNGCGITELPTCVCQLKQLRYLDASNLDMEELPCVHNSLRKLIYLNLRACRSLRRVHESFGMLPSLNYFNLSLCVGLTKLPASFKRLRSARRNCIVDLSGCQESVLVQFSFELQGDQNRTEIDGVPDPEGNQCPQHDKVPYPQSTQLHQPAISSMENKITGSHLGIPLETTSPGDVDDEHEESQDIPKRGRHHESLSSNNSTSGSQYGGKTAGW